MKFKRMQIMLRRLYSESLNIWILLSQSFIGGENVTSNNCSGCLQAAMIVSKLEKRMNSRNEGLKMDKDKNLKAILNEFLKNIEKDMQIEQVILFGSRTGNQTDKSSDVDLIYSTPQEFNELKDQVTIVREAVKTGVTIK